MTRLDSTLSSPLPFHSYRYVQPRARRFPRRSGPSRTMVQGRTPYSIFISGIHDPTEQSPRFARVKRPYTAAQVVSKRGTIPIKYPSDIQGKKLFATLAEHAKNGTPSHTYGACVMCSLRSLYFLFNVTQQARSSAGHPDGEIPRDHLRLWLAVLLDSVEHQRTGSRPCR